MKPMLAATVGALQGLTYPLLASPKLDGIRALVLPGVGLVSRTLKPIPNHYVRQTFSNPYLANLDGELILGQHDEAVFRRTTSAVMSQDDQPAVTFHVFDVYSKTLPYIERLSYLEGRSWPAGVKIVPHTRINKISELLEYEANALEDGFEGVMLRSLDGMYKEGRSTVNQGWLLKLKRFEDAEAIITGYEERMMNGNFPTTDALGHTKRSSHQANLSGRGDLGALVVRGINGPYKDVNFRIGTGFDDATRAALWATPRVGEVVKYKYFPQGSKDAPRFPVFLGFRPAGT